MLEQVLFIVWRESVEAILVVGIAYAWLKQAQARQGMRYLGLGVLAGLLVACLMGAALMSAGSWLQGPAQDVFQTIMVLVAAGLIVQMVMWMRVHARSLKSELEQGLAQQVENANYWGIAVLVAIAVAREGSETVVFLYGMGMAQLQSGGIGGFVLAALAGFALALLTFGLLQLGSRFLSWRWFFRVSEIMLLCLAASLLVSGVERMIGLQWLPAGPDPLWDTSMWLDDSHGLGGLLATFAGYRAWPPLTVVVAFVAYWVLILSAMRWQRQRLSHRQAASTEEASA